MSNARSVSRGRDAPVITYGRGGAGNKVRSPSRDDASSQTGVGPDDYSATRGRELPPSSGTGERVVVYGRGGAANHRSLSRDAVAESRNALQEEAKYVREHQNVDAPVSHGRGGAGNISGSRSRSRSRDPTSAATPGNPAVLVGRGGYGNVRNSEDTGTTLERLAEEEDAKRVAAERHDREEKEGKLHSTGRGGFSNFFHRTSAEVTREQAPRKSNEYVSTGRGGGGNIYHKE
ncbi:hypothetical protein FRC17_008821 [Serendipita sp. 399]|nr:hypothetical protein FRC17_008821 [Serendipita sp. 399]